MKPVITTAAISFTLIGIAAIPSYAHHSSAPHFDRDTTIEVTGRFKNIKFVNPHAYIYFDVEVDGAVQNWRCEHTSASQLKRWGWTPDMFNSGQVMTIKGFPAWREDNVCLFQTMVLEDGTEINRDTDYNANMPAQEVDLWADRPSTLANGQPNFSGPWRSLSFGHHRVFGTEYEVQQSAAGKKAAASYEMIYDNPILRCHFVNIVNGWNHDQNVNDIYQTDDAITLQYGFMDLKRTVHLRGQHPDPLTPSPAGHSIGHWDGNTLVVETKGFLNGVLEHRSGQLHSDQMSITESFYLDEDKQMLVREYEITDPLYLDAPAIGSDGQELSNVPYVPYQCVELSGENNIRPGEGIILPEGSNAAQVVDAKAPENLIKPSAAAQVQQAQAPIVAPEKSGLSWMWGLAIGGCIGLIAVMLRRRKP